MKYDLFEFLNVCREKIYGKDTSKYISIRIECELERSLECKGWVIDVENKMAAYICDAGSVLALTILFTNCEIRVNSTKGTFNFLKAYNIVSDLRWMDVNYFKSVFYQNMNVLLCSNHNGFKLVGVSQEKTNPISYKGFYIQGPCRYVTKHFSECPTLKEEILYKDINSNGRFPSEFFSICFYNGSLFKHLIAEFIKYVEKGLKRSYETVGALVENNYITVFSIFKTGKPKITSYYVNNWYKIRKTNIQNGIYTYTNGYLYDTNNQVMRKKAEWIWLTDDNKKIEEYKNKLLLGKMMRNMHDYSTSSQDQ